MKTLRTFLMAAGAVLAIGTAANATVITFEGFGHGSSITNGYQGLNWSNFSAYDTTTASNPSGYVNGVVSPSNVGYNAFANPASISVSSGFFDFNGGYFTGAWNDGLSLDIVGYTLGIQTYAATLTLNTNGPLNFVTNWTGVDTVTFNSFGGSPHGFSGEGAHFAVDNLTVNGAAIPEPGTWALMILGTGLAGAALRRARQVPIAA